MDDYMKFNKITVVVSIALAGMAGQAYAGSNLADARAIAMGGTGVAAADYLTSSFHNPALGAVYRNNDSFGVLLPGVGVHFSDSDDISGSVDDVVDMYDNALDVFESGSGDTGESKELSESLDKLDAAQPIQINIATGAAVAIPSTYVSINLFTDVYADIIASTDVPDKDGSYDASNPSDVATRFTDAEIQLAGVVVGEVGIALSKQFNILGQNISLGVSPKAQQYISYANYQTLSDFSITSFNKNQLSSSGTNFDVGALWTAGPFRLGVAVKDLISRDIETSEDSLTYEIRPKMTVGGAFVTPYFVASVDADLTEEPRFTGIDDDTQYIRIGVEGNAWGWGQLRLGYAVDLLNNVESTVSAGVGFSPYDTVSLDIGATYASTEDMGASMNLAFTF